MFGVVLALAPAPQTQKPVLRETAPAFPSEGGGDIFWTNILG